jgi:hypothetical protein
LVGDDEVLGGSGDGDDAAVMRPMVVGADQHEVVEFGGSAVLPMPYVMSM